MDPYTIIATALAAGAAAGGKDAAASAVRDSYIALRGLLQRHTGKHLGAAAAIETVESDPDGGVARLEAALAGTGSGDIDALRAAAEALLVQLPTETPGRESRIDLRKAKGVQIGDHNAQNNTFG